MPIRTHRLTKKFGGLIAVNDVNVELRDGERLGIIGPNGAGKTTLINLISGVLFPSSGKVFMDDKEITNLPCHLRVKMGLARTFQLTTTFPSLKVIENIALSFLRFHKNFGIFRRFLQEPLSQDIKERCYKALEMVNLAHKAFMKTEDLSFGERRKLEIAMALSLNPKYILLDEPFAGLSENEINDVRNFIDEYSSKFALLIVDHKVSKIIDFVDRLCVMDEGCIICEGDPQCVIEDERVRRIYWGRETI